MSPLGIFLLLTFLFLENVKPFTFSYSSRSNASVLNTSTRNTRRQPPPRIIFPGSITQEATTSTSTTSSPYPRRVLTTQLPLPLPNSNHSANLTEKLLLGNLNSTGDFVEGNATLTPTSIQNQTETNQTNVINRGNESCQTQPQMELNSIAVIADENAVVRTPAPKNFLTDEFIRSKLCSNVTDPIILSRHRFDLDAKVCSPINQQSHCGKYMIFQSYSGSRLYGFCECDYSNRTGNVGDAPLIFHNETNRCYYIYTKAYCRMEDWLELEKDGNKPVCKRNKCYNSGRRGFGAPPLASRDIPPEYVPLDGGLPCVKLNEPNGFCRKKGDIVAFRWPLQFHPSCGDPVASKQDGVAGRFIGDMASSTPACEGGSALSQFGHCQPAWEFD